MLSNHPIFPQTSKPDNVVRMDGPQPPPSLCIANGWKSRHDSMESRMLSTHPPLFLIDIHPTTSTGFHQPFSKENVRRSNPSRVVMFSEVKRVWVQCHCKFVCDVANHHQIPCVFPNRKRTSKESCRSPRLHFPGFSQVK